MLFSARCDEELVRTLYSAKERAGDGKLEAGALRRQWKAR
jgi:hypothetical protein